MEDKEAPNSAFTMSIKGMAMLTVCSVFSLRNLPSMAEYGWNIIFFLSAAAACFFIPSALVSAELASTYPQRGGVFIWAKEAFGPKLSLWNGSKTCRGIRPRSPLSPPASHTFLIPS